MLKEYREWEDREEKVNQEMKRKRQQEESEEIENRKLIITGDNAHAKKRIPETKTH